MFFARASNYDQKSDRLTPLHFPKGVTFFDNGLIQYATALTGYVKKIGSGSQYAKGSTTIEYINLPELSTVAGWDACRYMYELKECRLPSLRRLDDNHFCDCGKLEIFEVGSLTTFASARAMFGNPMLHTFIIGKDTAVSLPMQKCPLLTQECLHNIIENVADRTGGDTLTLTVHQDAYDRISEEYKTKLSNKNWNLA